MRHTPGSPLVRAGERPKDPKKAEKGPKTNNSDPPKTRIFEASPIWKMVGVLASPYQGDQNINEAHPRISSGSSRRATQRPPEKVQKPTNSAHRKKSNFLKRLRFGRWFVLDSHTK